MHTRSSFDSARAIAATRDTYAFSGPAPWKTVLNALPPWLRGQRLYWVVAAILVIAGMALGWSWLVAAGVLPILLSVLPCVAMCAIGLCAMNQGNRSYGGQTSGETAMQNGTALPGSPAKPSPDTE